MQPHAVIAREVGRAPHQVLAHRERRAGGQRDAQHRARSRVVVLGDQPPRVGEDRGLVLAHVVGRQAAAAAAHAHRAARRLEADAERARGADLGVDQPLLPGGEQVEVVGRRRRPGEQQLAETGTGCGLDRLLVEAPPDLVQLRQPVEQRRLLHARDAARQHLRQVVVGVDEAGQDHLASRVDPVLGRERRRHRWRAEGGDAVVLDQHPAPGQARSRVVHGGNQPRVVEQRAHRQLPGAKRASEQRVMGNLRRWAAATIGLMAGAPGSGRGTTRSCPPSPIRARAGRRGSARGRRLP